MHRQRVHREHRVHAVHRLPVALEAVGLPVLRVVLFSFSHAGVRGKVPDAHTALDAARREALASSQRADAAKAVVEVGVEDLRRTIELPDVIASDLECIGCDEHGATAS